jgi:hypothetical protein
MLTWSATVHTTLSTDTQPTIIVNFDDAKYIFNAGENAGRAFSESNGNWKKTKALFFTQSKLEKTSGLAGKQLPAFRLFLTNIIQDYLCHSLMPPFLSWSCMGRQA